MLRIHEDPNFHYEAIRALATTRFYGADIAEVLNILPNIKPGDFESWYNEWHNLAVRVLSSVDESNLASYSPITLRDIYFRVSRYHFVADFFLHGNPSDPRLRQNYDLWREYFDKANALLPIPGEHVLVKTDHGFDIPLIIYRASQASASSPRPTLIVGGGFDSNYEELYHVFGCSALERGYNVILYEGPGQPTLIHKQKVGFIYDWEKSVTPIVDYLVANTETLSFIDTAKLGLIGYSMGGYLAARAAAFEPRLAAVICIDGVSDMGAAALKAFPISEEARQQGNAQAFYEAFEATSQESSTNQRWFHDHLVFSFVTDSVAEILQGLQNMNLAGIASQIQCPAFIGDAEIDIFFKGQPPQIAKEIGSNATLFPFSNYQAAGEHCQSGALVYLNQSYCEWFAKIVGK